MKIWQSIFRASALLVLGVFASAAFGQSDYSSPYTVSAYAGLLGVTGGNDGAINYAQLNLPIGEAFDGAGNLYVADSGNNTIRKISPTGISSTFAGAAGSPGTSDGSGTNARFSSPSGVAVDASGNVYVADSGNHTIRKISSNGVVATLAGSAGNLGSADGAGAAARFNNPVGIALTSAGDLIVADSNNHTLRRVSSAGVVATLAGSAGNAGASDGTGGAASFRNPFAVAVDSAGNFWVSDSGNHTVRKVTATGAVTTFAGLAGSSGSSDGTGTAARFNLPQGLAFDASGNLFVADSGNSLIRKISAAGVVTTLAGSVGAPRSVDGTGAAAGFQSPAGLAFDSSGTLYVADYYNHTIRKVTPSAAVTTWLGAPGRPGSVDGRGAPGLLNNPAGIAIDSGRNLYVADRFNHTIRKISFTGVVSTLAGQAGSSGFSDGTGSAARFNYPVGVAVDQSGNVFVADQGNQTIRKITAAGVVTTYAGQANSVGSSDGSATTARFFSPAGVAVDSSGNVYVADSGNATIRKITPAGVVSTLAGVALSQGSADGTGNAARFNTPSGIAVDANGNLFVSDTVNQTVRKVTAAGAVTTLAGQAGTSGSRDTAGSVTFNFPYGLAVDGAGNIFIADYGNNIIRMIAAGGAVKTIAGTANITGDNSNQPTTGAAVQFRDPTGVAVDSFGTLYIVDGSNQIIRKATPPGAATITAQPASQAVATSQGVTFGVTASGAGLTYQWQKDGTNISGATGASYSIASPQAADAGSYTVLVTSGGITATSAPASLSVGAAVSNNPVNISSQPVSQSVNAGQGVTFTVAATGSSLTYQWQKNGAPISGATNASYAIASVQATDAASYTVVVTSGSTSVTSSPAVLTVAAVAGPTARITNLSILTTIDAPPADNFTLGYVVGNASASAPISLVIRAAGPSLGALGYPGTMADPQLALFAGSTPTGGNDNWGGTAALKAAFASVGAFPYTSDTSKDAAAVASITTSNNSVKVTAADGGTGAVIAEVYDATPTGNFSPSAPRLINVSVIKPIGQSLTVGFVIGGTGTKNVLIRASGPALTVFGFAASSVIADPKLELFDGASKSIGTNDNWGGTAALSAAFTAAGAFSFAPNSLDAAMTATLTPGNYTVVVTPSTGATGTGLVEVYELP